MEFQLEHFRGRSNLPAPPPNHASWSHQLGKDALSRQLFVDETCELTTRHKTDPEWLIGLSRLICQMAKANAPCCQPVHRSKQNIQFFLEELIQNQRLSAAASKSLECASALDKVRP